MSTDDRSGFLALRDRAYACVRAQGSVSEADLVAHVFGGSAPSALLARLAAPLRADPRLARSASGQWSLAQAAQPVLHSAAQPDVTALVVAATGPSPRRARVVRIVAIHLRHGAAAERFAATVHPETRVPDYVAKRLGLAREVLNDQPPFEAILDPLLEFLSDRPVLAQDAQLAWDFVNSEARRLQRVVARPALIDVNDLATRALSLTTKPTLAAVAARLGISVGRIAQPDEEARVLALIGPRLFEAGADAFGGVDDGVRQFLRRASSVAALPETPGVYVLRDRNETAVYIGKARQLRNRVGAYVNRPLGATRRLEGLVGSVAALEPVQCDTDLEALVLEDREIRRLQPRFNVVRAGRRARLWIRLPPGEVHLSARGRPRVARRLESSEGPTAADGAFVGPFVTETAAEAARHLAREVFALDALRTARDGTAYETALAQAWTFLRGERGTAEARARASSLHLLRRVLAFDVAAQILPADPFHARFALVRATADGAEAFVLDHAVCTGWSPVRDDSDLADVVRRLVTERHERTTADDASITVRWLGAQRTRGTLLCLPEDPQAAMDAVEDALALTLAAGAWEA